MKIIRGVHNIKKQKNPPILTIGNFDGVHLGHQALFKKVHKRAKEINCDSVVFTFEPHPLKILAPEKCSLFLTTFSQKLMHMEKIGIDIVICADFTPNFAAQNQREFVKNILLETMNVKEIVVGYDFSFGHGREGSIGSLCEMGKEFGFTVDVLSPFEINGEIVSSSLIRDLISNGYVHKAACYLGRPYSLDGKVIKGFKKGSDMGFPTANIDAQENIFPHTGVYAAKIFVHKKTFYGVVNVGYNPTFKRDRLSVEAHIFDFAENLYNEIVTISFIDKIRDEVTFSSTEKLKTRIQMDTIAAKEVFKGEEN